MPRLCSRLRSWMMCRNVSSATTSPPNAMTKVRPRNAWMYGAAERIHWTNARVVAEFAGGTAFGLGGIGSVEGRVVAVCADYSRPRPRIIGLAANDFNAPRQPQSRAARRSDAAAPIGAHPRGRRQRQDARADHADRVAAGDGAGLAARDSRRYVH